MQVVGWKGERVRLVPPDRASHLENALIWLNDPEITAALKHRLGVTRRQEKDGLAFQARVHLGSLRPEDVEAQVYAEPLDGAAPEVTSMKLSSPKPMRETDPAMAPATIEISPSRLL